MKKSTYIPTAKSYFSGAGGMDWGLIEGGIDIIQSVEIDTIASQTLTLNFKHRVVAEDISKKEVLKQIGSDIMVGTYPCTKYSTIADIHGTRTGDELYLHFFRHIAIARPEVYVLENVPGMLKFPVVMEAMTKLPDYYITTFCPVDSSIWLPQKRERLIIIATKKPFNFRPPTSTRRVSLKEILEKDPEVNIPQSVYSRLKGKYRDKPIISDPAKGDISPCAVAHYSKDPGTRLVKDKNFKYGVRPYTPREYARLQGFPDCFEFAGTDAEIYKQVGNAVSIPVGRWIGKELKRYFN